MKDLPEKDENMFKWLIRILTLLLVFWLGFLFADFVPGKENARPENHYALSGRVISLDRTNDTVYFIDGANNVWSFTGCEDWEPGDVVSCLMDNNGTPSIKDDIILKAQYGGELPA